MVSQHTPPERRDSDYEAGKVLSWTRTPSLTSGKSARSGPGFRICRATLIPERGRNGRRRRKQSQTSGAQSRRRPAGTCKSSCAPSSKKLIEPAEICFRPTPDALDWARELPGFCAKIPAANVRRSRRPGTRHAHAQERGRAESAGPRLSFRRAARNRQDLHRAHSGQGAQLHSRADRDALRGVRQLQGNRGRQQSRCA